MMLFKPTTSKLPFFLLSILVCSYLNVPAQDGRALFLSKCASCHSPFKDITGPKLGGLEERHKWADHKELLAWVNNPGGYMAKDATGYTSKLKAQFGSMMTGFPDLKLEEVTAIVNFINQAVAEADAPKGPAGPQDTAKESNNNAVIFGVISIILAIIALILMQVNSNLKKMSDDAEGIQRPEPVPFFRNKIYIAMITVILFIVGGYYITKAAVGLQRQKNYEPVQPVYYSHKVHAGIIQIN